MWEGLLGSEESEEAEDKTMLVCVCFGFKLYFLFIKVRHVHCRTVWICRKHKEEIFENSLYHPGRAFWSFAIILFILFAILKKNSFHFFNLDSQFLIYKKIEKIVQRVPYTISLYFPYLLISYVSMVHLLQLMNPYRYIIIN